MSEQRAVFFAFFGYRELVGWLVVGGVASSGVSTKVSVRSRPTWFIRNLQVLRKRIACSECFVEKGKRFFFCVFSCAAASVLERGWAPQVRLGQALLALLFICF